MTQIKARVTMRWMKANAWFITDKGCRRDSNQDSCYLNKEIGVYVVADGMGGHSGGEVASSIAVQTMEELLKKPDAKNIPPREILQRSYEESSRRIFDKAAYDNPELSGMGTTMVSAYVRGNTLYIGNVGDSRCYLFRKPFLWQITEDHSLINEQIRAGLLSEEQAKHFVGRNVITRSVGYEREVHPDIVEREIVPGDIYILCSDGLSGLVDDTELTKILNETPPDHMASICTERALANGGDDNVTVLVLQFTA